MFDLQMFEVVVNCFGQGWTPRIGDPDLTGWLTVAAYLFCALLSVGVANQYPRVPGRGLWFVMIALMLFLAVNKQLDLQSALTATGRCVAREQGWYSQRRAVQAGFIELIVAVAAVFLLTLLIFLRRSLLLNVLALVGLTVLIAFILTRAMGFHHMDRVIGRTLFDIRYNYLFENAGLLLIALNAILLLWHKPQRQDRSRPHLRRSRT